MENTLYLTAYQQRILRAIGDALIKHAPEGVVRCVDISWMIGSNRTLNGHARSTIQKLINLHLVINIHKHSDTNRAAMLGHCRSEYTLTKNGWHIYRQL